MGQVTARDTSAIRRLWRSRLGAALPSRVLLEIQRREEQSERLVGWIQLLLVLIFGAFYLLGARAEGARGASFTTTILTIYIVFTLFRVWLSYRRVLPAWFLVMSIIADVGLLCALIVSFHVEYDQPAAFYLKAPTMIYLFIFISVRMLRFDPRFVLLTGLTATLGWFLLVVYALNTDMGDMHITHNYVEYLTSNTILIGAEVDRGIALLGDRSLDRRSKAVVAIYGVRGIGSLYYLAYASTHVEFVDEGPLWALVAFTIFASTVFHGLTATATVEVLDREYVDGANCHFLVPRE